MADTLVRKCYVCGYFGTKEEFRKLGECQCPQCGRYDNFPYRRYRCVKDGELGDQAFWYPEMILDKEPNKRDKPIPCKRCVIREASAFLRTKKAQGLSRENLKAQLKKIETTPAKLEEVPIQLKVPRRTPAKPISKGFLTQ